MNPTELAVLLFLPTTIALINFSVGLGLVRADFERIVAEPLAVGVGAVAQLVGLPLLGFGLAHLFGLEAAFAVGLVLVSACPGGATSNLFTALARGDLALSVTLTALSGIVTVFTVPLVVGLATSHFAADASIVALPVGETMLKLALVVLLPIGAGMTLRARRSEAALRLQPWARRTAVFFLAVVIVGAVLRERQSVGLYAATVGPAVVALNVLAIVSGFGMAVAMRLSRARRVAISLEVGVQNGALAIAIAVDLLGSRDAAAAGVIYSLLAYLTSAVVVWIARWGDSAHPAVQSSK